MEITDPVSWFLHVSAYIYIKIREAETRSSTLNRLEFWLLLYVSQILLKTEKKILIMYLFKVGMFF